MSTLTTKTGSPKRRLGDLVFANLTRAAGLTILVVLAGVAIFLTVQGAPALGAKSVDLKGHANFLGYVAPLVFGTLLAAAIALAIALPLSLGVALAVSHFAPRRLAAPIGYVIDLLAAVPSVVYGLWGISFLGPQLGTVYQWLGDHLGWIPLFAGTPLNDGRTILTAGMVLAIMVLPIITAITREIFIQTPRLNQEAALALGATRWEMVRLAVLPYGRSGIVSAAMLGLGRALGETMAVAMVLSVGSGGVVSFKLLTASNPSTIAANIALTFSDATSVQRNVLIASGLVLFVITFAVNFGARAIVARYDTGSK
ncbi:MAG TPA: phosphate ABC transporter permease subunit PstC [Marmoricola sp.]|nr:phosphate ABC transporter permease subunit PstC [Marmoricola sp.]